MKKLVITPQRAEFGDFCNKDDLIEKVSGQIAPLNACQGGEYSCVGGHSELSHLRT